MFKIRKEEHQIKKNKIKFLTYILCIYIYISYKMFRKKMDQELSI